MNRIYTLALLLSTILPGRGLAQALGISPDPTLHAQCPGVPLVYQISSWMEGCHSVEPPVNGILVEEKQLGLKRALTIRWNDSANPGSLTVHRSDSANCSAAAAGKSWEIPIASVAGLAPDLTGPDQIPLFTFSNSVYTATLRHHQRGSLDPDPFTITKFEWQSPVSWIKFLVDPNSSAMISVFPDTSEGCIKVRGQQVCGSMSEWATICPERVMDVPCPMFTFPTSLICGNKQNVFVSVSDFSFVLPDATYNWQVSGGWEIVNDPSAANKSIVVLKPDGFHDGIVSVTLSGLGKTSAPCTATIPYLPDFEDSEVSGPDEVCSSATFQPVNLPANTTVSWEVTNFGGATGPVPFVQTSGSGPLANLELADPDARGYYVISFTAADPCGEEVLQKKFYAGKPRIYSAKIDGDTLVQQTLCPGNHRLEVSVFGSDCVEWNTNLQGYADCRHFDFPIRDADGDCAELIAVCTNTCGSTEQMFPFCPQAGCPAAPTFDLLVSPNPTNFVVRIEGVSSDENKSKLALIETLEIYNALGQRVYTWNDAPRQLIVLPVDQLQRGVYVIHASIWGQRITKKLLIKKRR